MKLEDALKLLRRGATIKLGSASFCESRLGCFEISARDLLSENWEGALTDDQIVEIWESDARMRSDTGQPAQAALLRECIKLLRTRRLL